MFCVIVAVLAVTLIGFVGCVKLPDSKDLCTVKFDQKQAVFTIPQDATLRVLNQTKNFVTKEVKPKSQKEKGDFVQYVFANGEQNMMQTFRIEKEGFVTKAGYFCTSGNFEFKFDSKVDIWKRESYGEKPANGLAGIDDIMLTNVGNNYFKVMCKGEKFDLIAFRNSMIVNDNISNVEIEPNFKVEILSGNSVSFERIKENAFCVNAESQGVTQVKLKYQAIEVLNNGKVFCYNASDLAREVVITFAVGEDYFCDSTVKVNGKNFDSEFDTVYYDSDICEIDFEVNNADKVIFGDKNILLNDGKCKLNLSDGANVIEIKRENKSQFMTIYARKILVTVSNISNNTNEISAGDKVAIKVTGIYTAVPKLSGVYNPTQNFAVGSTPTEGSRMKFIMPNGEIITANFVSQYFNGANTYAELVVKEEYLVDGELTFKMLFAAEWWGSELGIHRLITSNGFENNLNAELHRTNLGVFVR